MMGSISRLILRLWNFKLVGGYKHIDQFVVAVIPHTSNWDFPLGLLVRSALEKKICFVGKSSLFKPPFGFLFKAMNGYPVDRSKNNNYVEAVADIFRKDKSFSLCISPEGTRRKVDKLKTGFYYIAKAANVPIILCKFDWSVRTVTMSEPFYTTDDYEKDMAFILDYFKGVKGLIPENGFAVE